MKKIIASLLSFCLAFSCGFIPQAKASTENMTNTIYVSPTGSDSADGSLENPLKTLEAAKAKAVSAAQTATEDVNVIIRGGRYDVGEGLNFEAGDSGTDKARINFKAYEGEEVLITNAVVLDNTKFSIVTDDAILKRIPAEARGKVYSASLTSMGVNYWGGISRAGMQYIKNEDSRMLIVDGGKFTIARWPNNGYVHTVDTFIVPSGHKFSYSENKGNQWATATEAWIGGFFYHLWADDMLPVREIDCYNKTIQTTVTHVYGLGKDKPFYIFNLIEELDIPGEWFLDSQTGILYMYPKTDIKKSKIEFAPYATDLVTLNGTKNITFEGITFEGTRTMGVNMTDCENVLIDNCEFKNIGQRAVNISAGHNNGVKNSYVHDIGKGGISFAGGDYINLTPSGNFVENCHIERYALSGKTYTPAVTVTGIGNRVSHCEINNGSHMAMSFGGIDNIIEYNEIYNVLKYSNDMGALYSGRSWTTTCTIRYNYIHDCRGEDLRTDDIWYTQAFYMDDGLNGINIYGNIVQNLNRGVHGHFARNCKINNNVFIDCDMGMRINPQSSASEESINQKHEAVDAAWKEGGIEAVKSLIPDGLYDSYVTAKARNWDLYVKKFPWLLTNVTDEYAKPKYNQVTKNIMVNVDEMLSMPEFVAETNVVENNYEVKKEASDAELLASIGELAKNVSGFEMIDVDKIGIQTEKGKNVGEFMALGPANGAVDVPSENVVLTWENSEGASRYEIVVAEDKDFEKIILQEELITNHRTMTKLKSGGQKYYWKVYAYSDSNKYENTPVENSNGVQTFRTKLKEEVDTEKLKAAVDLAWNYHDAAVEQKDGGTYNDGAKDLFSSRIKNAERFLESSKAHSPLLTLQNGVDSAVLELEKYQTHFLNSQITQVVGIKDMLSSASGWNKSVEISGGALKWSGNGGTGYKDVIETYKILRFKATFNPGAGWTSMALRVGNSTAAPWSTTGYAFLVKSDTIELQEFGSVQWIKSVPNDCLQPGTEHLVEFGAVNDGEGVRITLVVDGKEIFNVFDDSSIINDAGYLAVYNANGSSVTLRAAE